MGVNDWKNAFAPIREIYSNALDEDSDATLTKSSQFIAEKGYDPQFGARPLKRAIQKYLEDEMAEAIIKASVVQGDTISVGFDKKTEKIKIKILTSAEKK